MCTSIPTTETTYSPQPRHFSTGKKSVSWNLMPQRKSSDSGESPKHVVIVMDGLKEFTTEPLEWFLKNIPFHVESCTVTLLGVMPWLNIPLSSKTWSDIWTLDLEDLSIILEKSEWKNDVKYQKLRRLLRLCQLYGVQPQMKSEMGYPLHLLAVKNIINLHPTLIVFDRHHHKYKDYYAEKIRCDMVIMNEEGEVEMIKDRRINEENGPVKFPASSVPSSILMLAEHLKKIFKPRAQQVPV